MKANRSTSTTSWCDGVSATHRRSDASPWVRAVMEDFANNSVRDIAVQCAAQSAKTQTVIHELRLLGQLAEPGRVADIVDSARCDGAHALGNPRRARVHPAHLMCMALLSLARFSGLSSHRLGTDPVCGNGSTAANGSRRSGLSDGPSACTGHRPGIAPGSFGPSPIPRL